jgi:hypothetical protein
MVVHSVGGLIGGRGARSLGGGGAWPRRGVGRWAGRACSAGGGDGRDRRGVALRLARCRAKGPPVVLLRGIVGDGRIWRGRLDELCGEVTIGGCEALCCRSALGSPEAFRLLDYAAGPGGPASDGAIGEVRGPGLQRARRRGGAERCRAAVGSAGPGDLRVLAGEA